MPKPIAAIGYVRVNAPQAFTVSEQQRRSIQAWAARTGHMMVSWVEDIWVPGTRGNELGLTELVDGVRQGEASVVAAEEASRISRLVAEYRSWADRLEAAGGRLAITGRSE